VGSIPARPAKLHKNILGIVLLFKYCMIPFINLEVNSIEQRNKIRELILDRSQQALDLAQGRLSLANSIANILLEQAPVEEYNRKWPWEETWVDQVAQTNHQIRTWLLGPFKSWSTIIMYWANCNLYNAREFLIHFSNRIEPKPDLSYFLTNWLVALGLTDRRAIQDHQDPEHQREFARALKHLFTELDWISLLDDPKVNVQNMSGFRDTILGSYKALQNITISEHSGNYWDIGGGHHTPWLNKIHARPWCSLDLHPSWDVGTVTLRRVALDGSLVLLEGSDLENYQELLRNQPWQYYDVFEYELPPGTSTTVVSTGFVASTMTDIKRDTRPPEWQFERRMDQSKLVTYMGVLGMLAPLYQGGDLEIVTVSRPSGYATQWNLVQLQWVGGKLVKDIRIPFPDKGTTGIRGFKQSVKEGRHNSIDPLGNRWQHLSNI
jgi:hypothetical protein